MTAEQCNVIASTSAETSRVPNTKAQKKITIDEYKVGDAIKKYVITILF